MSVGPNIAAGLVRERQMGHLLGIKPYYDCNHHGVDKRTQMQSGRDIEKMMNGKRGTKLTKITETQGGKTQDKTTGEPARRN